MYLFYSFCLTVGLIVALPYFLYQGIFHKKYLTGLRQRLGLLPAGLIQQVQGCIWIHTVSVGEFLAVLPLLKALKQRWPARNFLITTTTLTGQKLAQDKLAGIAQICYFPIDWEFAVRRSLRLIHPSLVLIMETEIWPNFLRTCRFQQVPVLLINGRISDNSIARYRKIKWFMSRILADFSFFLVQTEKDRRRLVSLGVENEKIEVSKNIKYEVHAPEDIEKRSLDYRRLFGVTQNQFVVVAGSTMRGEEEMVLSAFKRMHAVVPSSLLILAPRHLERLKEVENRISSFGVQFKRRSELPTTGTQDVSRPVILLDTMGELSTIYHLADLVFIGGSLVPKGGHNILEPALFGKPILFGSHMNNFREIADYFLQRQAALQVNNALSLGDSLIELAQNPSLRNQLGLKAEEILAQNRGATRKVLHRIEEYLADVEDQKAIPAT